MAQHHVFIPSVVVESMLELPDGVHILGAYMEQGEVVLSVASEEDLGAIEVNAMYGNVEEDEKAIHFGMFEARSR